MPSLIPQLLDSPAVLLVRARGCVYALALGTVVETMRPLPSRPVPGMPAFLQGLAVIRGEPVPVVDLATFIGGSSPCSSGRFVLVRAGERRVAIAVEAVLGVVRLDGPLHQGLAPLLEGTNADLVAAVGVRDQQLLLVLQAARLVPEEAWRELQARGKVP